MRNALVFACLAAFAGCEFQPVYGQVAQIPWDVQVDRPVPHDVAVWQGETVDLMPRLVQGIRPVALTNAPVEFRYREASLPTNTYRYVAASVNTNNGVVSVRWRPDYDAGAAWYDYQIIVGSNAANPRCFGRIIMRPTIGWHASTNPPPPITLYPTRAEFQAVSNALAIILQTVITNESDTLALTVMATNRTLRLYDTITPNGFYTVEDGTNLVYRSVQGPFTNSGTWVYFSPDFRTILDTRPPFTSSPFPFQATNGWSSSYSETMGIRSVAHVGHGSSWSSVSQVYPITLPLTSMNGYGYAVVDTNRVYFTTNQIIRYDLAAMMWAATNAARFLTGASINGKAATISGGAATWNLSPTNIGAATATDVTNAVYAVKEFHADSYTNLIWRTIWSNGWCWAVAYTNTP